MIRQPLLVLALGTALIVPGVATGSAVQTPASGQDTISCLAIGLLIAGGDDAEDRSNGSMFALYFFSRARMTLSEAEVQRAIREEVARIEANPDRITTEAERCGAELTSVGEELTRLAHYLNPPQQAQPKEKGGPSGPPS